MFFRLSLVMDIYSRKIVGWEIHENETADHAALLIRKACLAEGISEAGLVVHSDNGSPMKGATLLATLQRLGIVPSFSRPSVSNDNPYSESLFGTMNTHRLSPPRPSRASRRPGSGSKHSFAGTTTSTSTAGSSS